MPTAEQLSRLQPVDGDGATVQHGDDGSTTTTWPDGTVRIDEPDGHSVITFPDFSVLNIQTDGTETLNDVNGKPLDPTTGQPLSGSPGQQQIPTPPPDALEKLTQVVEGASAVADLAEAEGILRVLGIPAVVNQQYRALFELANALSGALSGELSPVGWFTQVLKMVLNVIKAMEVEERGAGMRSWCYTVVYDAMGMGTPPEPTFKSLKGADQEALDQQEWDNNQKEAQEQLADGQNGVALRNRVLLLIAKCGGDPASAVTEMWAEACNESGDSQLLQAYPQLSWPQPTGV